jgi:hypothetical protein
MIPIYLLSSLMLTMPAQADGRAPSVLGGSPVPKAEANARADPAPKADRAEDPAAALAKYNEIKDRTPRTVAAQSRLAAWCEEHGLKAEAYVHYAEVVRLDPRREAAWRKLGYKKYGGRWLTDAQIAEAEDQKKADRLWAPQLRRIHRDIHGTNGAKKRDLAQTALDAISDPKAIPSIYREFSGTGPADQLILIQVLGQIDRPLSTEVLAMMSVYGRTPEVRRRAAELLRGRPVGDYLEILVGLMVDPLRYEVKPVGGPGSPGVLYVEGQQFNIARFYAPPTPNDIIRVGDVIGFGPSGMPTSFGSTLTTQMGTPHRVQGSKTLVTRTDTVEYGTYDTGQIMAEAQNAAVAAEGQLEADVARIRAINAERRQFNDIVVAVASYATGQDHGQTAKQWRDAQAARQNSGKQPQVTPAKPTFTEMVPLAYQPVVVPRLSFMKVTSTYVDT